MTAVVRPGGFYSMSTIDDSQLEVDAPQSRQLVSTWPLCECDVVVKSSYLRSHCRVCGRRITKPRSSKRNEKTR